MQILCEVNQAECFRRGIDAPRSTIKVEVDPSKLPEDLRGFVADHLYDGYKFGFDLVGSSDEIRIGKGKEQAYIQFELHRPDLLGFMEAVLRSQAFTQAQKNQEPKYLKFTEWLPAAPPKWEAAEELVKAQKSQTLNIDYGADQDAADAADGLVPRVRFERTTGTTSRREV
jgi:hypothetical protein